MMTSAWHCHCRKCTRARDAGKPLFEQEEYTRMILCAICGNKRCPKANDHDHKCTKSNEAGQLGSAYPKSVE